MASRKITILILALTFNFSTTFAQTTTKAPQQDTTKSIQTLRFADQAARPKGGMQRFLKYLSKHVSYPEAAIENNIQGKVIIGFIVNKDGQLSDFKIKKDIGAGCGEAVKKALEDFPYAWTPGKNNGQPVKTYYELPFTFSLQ